MKRFCKYIITFFISALLAASVSGCQKKEYLCPFTSVTWESTPEDITKLEGDSSETYDSIYDGITYTYPKEYDGLQGTVKYMFDGNSKLVSMSWMYEAKDVDDLTSVYDRIHSEAEKALGKSGFKYNREELEKAASPGDVWYLESGNIILTTFIASDLKVLQYTYKHPDVSEERPQSNE